MGIARNRRLQCAYLDIYPDSVGSLRVATVCFQSDRIPVHCWHADSVLDVHVSNESSDKQLDDVTRQLGTVAPAVGILPRYECGTESACGRFINRFAACQAKSVRDAKT